MWDYPDNSAFPGHYRMIPTVAWMKNRTVIVYLRLQGDGRSIRLRTFNRHQVKGCWYPTRRLYIVPIESAPTLAKAIEAAAEGEGKRSE